MIHWPWCNLLVRKRSRNCLFLVCFSLHTSLTRFSPQITIYFHVLTIFVKADGQKRCSNCGESKEPKFFRKNPRNKQCLACLAAKQKIYSIKLKSEYNIVTRILFTVSSLLLLLAPCFSLKFLSVFCERGRWMGLLELRSAEDFRLFLRWTTTMQRL